MTHKLMIKTHNDTGLKYLCYTQSEGITYKNYKGSGKYWKRHLNKHGENITTELILETDDYAEFKLFAKQFSEDNDVVKSSQWANIRPEDGTGGDTVSNRIWITNGNTDKYHFKNLPIPAGWVRGRNNCVFNNPNRQREFGAKADPKRRGLAIKKAWDSGNFVRDHSKCGVKGDDNPAKRPEVRQKMKEAAQRRWKK